MINDVFKYLMKLIWWMDLFNLLVFKMWFFIWKFVRNVDFCILFRFVEWEILGVDLVIYVLIWFLDDFDVFLSVRNISLDYLFGC